MLQVSEEITLADPERALAVAYAPASRRTHLTTIFALDERMGQIVAATTEPMIGLMRLAWWRETLEKLDQDRVAGEPLLAALAATGVSGATLAAIEDGWAAMLDGDMDAEAIARHGRERGGGLFTACASALHATDPQLPEAGAGWALADLAHRHSDQAVRHEARGQALSILTPFEGRTWSRNALPLAALAVLAARDAANPGPRRQGSPGRLLRLLRLRLFRR